MYLEQGASERILMKLVAAVHHHLDKVPVIENIYECQMIRLPQTKSNYHICFPALQCLHSLLSPFQGLSALQLAQFHLQYFARYSTSNRTNHQNIRMSVSLQFHRLYFTRYTTRNREQIIKTSEWLYAQVRCILSAHSGGKVPKQHIQLSPPNYYVLSCQNVY